MNHQAISFIQNSSCCICGASPCEVAFILSVYQGGPYQFYNMIPLCINHHETHAMKGSIYMARNYSSFDYAIKKKGWTYSNILEHPRFITN